ncbi:MAG TPA: hypothetical protein VFJ13_06595 [Paracoccaceae bacterium]|nr:hypothetical protein [Paracoccaceae bacterium]
MRHIPAGIDLNTPRSGFREAPVSSAVIPAKAGIFSQLQPDPRLRGDDGWLDVHSCLINPKAGGRHSRASGNLVGMLGEIPAFAGMTNDLTNRPGRDVL